MPVRGACGSSAWVGDRIFDSSHLCNFFSDCFVLSEFCATFVSNMQQQCRI